MLQTYNVALNEGVDYDQFWSEIETAGSGSGHVPERAVQVVNERPASLRQCWYALNEEEAQKLRSDPRVFCVEFPPEFRDDVKFEGCTTQTGLWYKDASSVNPANNQGINWGLFRMDSVTDNTPGYPAQGTLDHNYLCDGTGVDVVIVDGGIQPDHPEFSDANGVSRVQQIDWYAASGVPGTMPSFATFYSDYDGHGTLTTGLAAGKIYGRAKNSLIYCMTIDVSRVNPTTFIPITSALDCIKGWHNNKPIDPATGYKRPTVVSLNWISYATYANITGGSYRGTPWTGTSGQTQYGMTGSNNNGTGLYGVRISSTDTDVAELLAAGVHLVSGNGNYYQIADVAGGQDYNNYYTDSSGGTNYYMRGGSPSAAPGVINVGGITCFYTAPERLYPYTAKGPRTDVFAPAVGLVTSVSNTNTAGATTPYPTNSSYRIGVFNGTSVAGPLVAGMVGQMLQAFPNSSPAQIRQLVIDYATPNVLYDAGSTAYTNSYRLHGAANRYAYLPQDLPPFQPTPTPSGGGVPATTPMTYNDYVTQIANMAVVGYTNVTNSSGNTIAVGVDPAFNAIIPQMLNYAELRIQRDLDLLPSQTSNTSYTLTAGNNQINISSNNFVTVQTVSVTSGTAKTPLLPVTKEYLQNVYNDSSYLGKPKLFAMYGGDASTGGNTYNNIIFGPYPDSNYPLTITGTVRLQTLYPAVGVDGYPVIGTGTTFISTNLPDMLIMASMIYISAFQRNFGRESDDPAMAQSYEAQYQVLKQGAIPEEYRKKFEGSAWSSDSTSPAATPTR